MDLSTPLLIIIMTIFNMIYLPLLVRRLIQNQFDLYDVLFLSLISIIPSVFVYFPSLMSSVASVFGVQFNYIFLFSSLFLAIFIFMHRMILKMHKVARMARRAIQETSIINLEKKQDQSDQHAV